MARKRQSAEPAQPTLALGLSKDAERSWQLSRERDRLFRQVAHKKRLLERCRAEAASARDAVAAKLRPFLDERDQIDRDMHALFAALLSKGRLPAVQRRVVLDAYLSLQADGAISERAVPNASKQSRPKRPKQGSSWDDAPPVGESDPRVLGSAPKVTGTGRETLRASFKRLAMALHPDRARSEAEKARRTEIMKQVTRAYEEQDLARLMEIEKLYATSVSFDTAESFSAEQSSKLEAAVVELRRQLRELSKHVREIKNSEHHRIARDLERGEPSASLDEVVRGARFEIRMLRNLHEHVRAFAQGRIGYRDFVQGPPHIESDFDAMLEIWSEAPGAARGRWKKTGVA
jgi:hypothetical protein